MAENQTEIIVTRDDRLKAARIDRDKVIDKVKRLPRAHLFQFVKENHAALRPILKTHAPLLYNQNGASDNEVFAQTLSAIRHHLTLGITNKLQLASLGIKPVDAMVFAKERHIKEEAKAQSRALSKSLASSGFKKIAQGLYQTASAPVIGLTSQGLKGFAYRLGSGAKNLFVGSADLTQAFYEFGQVSMPTRVAVTGAAFGMLGMAAVSPVNAAPYLPNIGDFKATFNQACTPEILNGPMSNAVYTLSFDRAAASPQERHLHDMAKAGAKQGVPAIVLEAFFRLETAHGTDFRANNSSAEGGAMMITDTQIRYAHTYGTKTIAYLEAKERLQAGTASDVDNSLVKAMDYVAGMDVEKLSDMVEAKKYPGEVHDALKFITISPITAQATALSILKIMPNIGDPSLTPKQHLEMAATTYAQEHNLGAPNFNMFSNVAAKYPDLIITDKKMLAAYAGQRTADKISEIIGANPGLYKDLKTLTAGKALESIKTQFKSYVQKTFNEYEAQYNAFSSVMEACVTKEGVIPPATIPRYEARMYDFGIDKIMPPHLLAKFQSAGVVPAAPVSSKGAKPAGSQAVDPARFGDSKIPIPMPRPEPPST